MASQTKNYNNSLFLTSAKDLFEDFRDQPLNEYLKENRGKVEEDFVKAKKRLAEELAKEPIHKVPWISIDPGMSNLASTYGTYYVVPNSEEVVIEVWLEQIHCKSVVDPKGMDLVDMERQLNSWLLKTFTPNMLHGAVCLIEKQYMASPRSKGWQAGRWHVSIKLQLIQAILYTLFNRTKEVFTMLPSSSHTKQALGLATGSYENNKQASVDFIPNIVANAEDAKLLSQSHHVAETIIQIYNWIYESHAKIFRPRNPKITIKVIPTPAEFRTD